MKRMLVAVLALSLLTAASPGRAADTVPYTVTVPAEGAKMKDAIEVRISPAIDENKVSLRIELGHGRNAVNEFRLMYQTPTWVPSELAHLRQRDLWRVWLSPEGLSGGDYTLRLRISEVETGRVLQTTLRNFMLDAPDRSPKVGLDAPETAMGMLKLAPGVTDDDLSHWRLEAFTAGGDSVRLENGTGATPARLEWFIGLWDEGEYTVRLTAWDRAGNQSTVEKKVKVLSPAPSLQVQPAIAEPGPMALTVEHTAVTTVWLWAGIMADGSDHPVATGSYTGSYGTWTSKVPVDLTWLPPGRYRAVVTAEDSRGRKASAEVPLVVEQTVAPPILSPLPAYTDGEVVLQALAPEGVSASRLEIYRFDAQGPYLLSETGFAKDRPEQEGAYNYRAVMVTANGHRAVSQPVRTVVDLSPPVPGPVTVAHVDGLGLNLRWEAASDPSGIASYEVLLTEGLSRRVLASIGPEERSFSRPLPPGEYAVTLAAVDQAGKRSETQPLAFRVEEGVVALLHQGRFLSADPPATLADGLTWVPLRVFSEALGYEVRWSPQKQVATIRHPLSERVVMAFVGETELQVLEGEGERVAPMPAAPRLVSGSLLVPLRALTEALGAEVRWLESTHTVELLTQ